MHPAPGQLVGRAVELARLEMAFEAAVMASGTTVLVTGEAGIGKTRLVSALGERARRAGAAVLTGRCLDLVGAGLPYLAVMEALRGSTEWIEGARPAFVAERPASDGNEPDGQLRLFEDVRGFLGRLATTTPVVLILEDLHWADTSTLDLAGYLAHTIGDCRMLIVATCRDDETRLGDPLPRFAASLVRAQSAIHVPLLPLSGEETTVVIEQAREHPVSRDVIESIVERSGGNPLFAEELLGAAERGEAELPHLLRDTLLARIEPLDADTHAVLQVAAAVGRDVPYGVLAAVVSLPEPRLRRALRHAVEQRVLVADQRSGTFRFRHALLAEAVYAGLIPGEHEELHARIARAISLDRPTPAELAHHWTAARRPAEALPASILAARAAEELSGRAEALAHLERALSLWPLVERAADLAGMSLEAVLRWAAELANMIGSGVRAAELIRRAIELHQDGDDPFDRAVLYERLGMYLLPTGDRNGGLAALERAVELVPEHPPSDHRVRVLASLGQAMTLSWRFTEARSACENAIAAAKALGNPPPAQALDILGNVLCYLGEADEGLKILTDACAREPGVTTPRDLVRPYVYHSDALTALGRLSDAAQVARDGLALARRLGVERGAGNVLAANAAEALLGLGDWTGAENVLADALRSGGHFWSFGPHCRRAQLAIGRGETDCARRHLEAGSQAAVEPEAAQDYYSLVAELALWEGDPEAAAAAVDNGLAADTGSTPPPCGARLSALGLRAEADRIQVAAARRDRAVVETARHRAGALLTRARSTKAAWSPDIAAWQAVADAEHSRVERQADPDRWLAATRAWDRLNRPYPAAYCRWRLAEALLSTERPGADSRPPAREAFRIAVRLGAEPLQREVGLLAQRARFDLDEPLAAASPDRYAGLGLTSREGDVLELLAQGCTNRQIAGRLFISAKTASVHVTHILEKLGVSRRFEAAAIAQRLQDPWGSGGSAP
ncbi:AAA family ATPase [Actinoplanes sp. NPDC051513]|uniref:helix-turn-helix transcriptional regulator n=1 Tax=Actinoplanes sp. NPDC051513 TaxID=3363908 RepID=UPI0037B4AC10